MDEQDFNDEQAKKLVEQFGTYDPRFELLAYSCPPLDLLDNTTGNIPVDAETLDKNKNIIISTLQFEGVVVSKINAVIGPSLTLYELTLLPGTRVAKIRSLKADLSLRLGANVQVVGPLPGRGTMGIEIPHITSALVRARSVLAKQEFANEAMELPVAFGRTKYNEPVVLDLVKLPHLLIAGATGQGKSVLLNAILVSLLYKKHPSELKLVLIDLNELELGPFRRIAKHFLAAMRDANDAVVTDVTSAIRILNGLLIELDQRYELFRAVGVRQLKEYNDKFVHRRISDPERHRYLPYIVVMIDDFAKLLTADSQSEILLSRLAQLGRPAGIHLIIATQRPSVNVITGSIKSNFAARAAFRLPAAADSRTIIDMHGAEQLRGEGEMLLQYGTELIQLQGMYVSTDEVTRLAEFISLQYGYSSAFLLPEYWDGSEQPAAGFDLDAIDPFFEEAARLVVIHQQGSTSLIQRKLKLGYNRAGRIVDQLEGAGILGPFDGSEARDVLYADEYTLEKHLERLISGLGSTSETTKSVSEKPVEAPESTRPITSQSNVYPKKRSLFARIFGV